MLVIHEEIFREIFQEAFSGWRDFHAIFLAIFRTIFGKTNAIHEEIFCTIYGTSICSAPQSANHVTKIFIYFQLNAMLSTFWVFFKVKLNLTLTLILTLNLTLNWIP